MYPWDLKMASQSVARFQWEHTFRCVVCLAVPREASCGWRLDLRFGIGVQFGLGRRDCAGRNMAMLEGTTLLGLLHARFDFTPVDGYKFEPELQGFMQAPKNGLKVHVSVRKPHV
jgi:hypothetical protein